jgi:hypothetical protein
VGNSSRNWARFTCLRTNQDSEERGVVMRNQSLADLIQEAGYTYEALARAVARVAAENGDHGLRTNRSAVAHWVKGVTPAASTPTYLAEALSRRLGRPLSPADIGFDAPSRLPAPYDPDPTALTTLCRADLATPVVRRSVLFSAALLPLSAAWLRDADDRGRRARAAGSPMIGEAEIVTVRQITKAFNIADETLGGGHGRDAVVQYLLTDVAAYLRGRFRDEQTRAAMYGAAAELAYLAGWKAHDMQLEGIAQRYYTHALQLAHDAVDSGHTAWVLRILAHQALDLHQTSESVDLADHAWRISSGLVSPATESLFAITAARAHAAAGSPQAAAAALHKAEDGLTNGLDDVPSWAALAGNVAATVTSNAGKTFAELGEHHRAESRFTSSAGLRAEEGFRRAGALNLTQVAESQAAQGHADEACETWTSALGLMPGVSSARHRAAVGRARGYLRQYTRRKVPGAASVDARCRDLLAQSAR